MFRILLVAALLLASAQLGLARGSIVLSSPETPYLTDQAVGATATDVCCDDAQGADAGQSHCKTGDCKAVIGVLSPFFAGSDQRPDGPVFSARPPAVDQLEPRPPSV